MKHLFSLLLLFVCLGSANAQEPKMHDQLTEKAVIGFPEITTEQLNLIATEFAKYPQIVNAKFYFSDHYCMLLTLNGNTNFTVYAELLKVLTPIYDINKCYLKPESAYAQIVNASKAGSELIVK